MKLTRLKIAIRMIRQTIFLKCFTIFKMKHDESFLITYSLWDQFYLKRKICLESCIGAENNEHIATIDKGRDEQFVIMLSKIYGEYVYTLTKRRIDGTCLEEYVKYIPDIDTIGYSPMMLYKLIKNQCWTKF